MKRNIRQDFPILEQEVYGKPLAYFDNAATTQKPAQVIDVLSEYYLKNNSNIHRGVHYLSQKATDAFEQSREKVRSFINAPSTSEIIFTRGTTESINLVAYSFSKRFLSEGDEVLISGMEHHSNIVPWQLACQERKAKLKVIPITEKGELDITAALELLDKPVKVLALTHVSNSLGTINDIKFLIDKAHEKDIVVLIDGAQAVAHTQIDVIDLDCDFYCFSAHKMYGPMGVGIVYGKEELLNEMPPWQGGGEMIKNVTFERTTYNELPFKFEAGTPSVGDVLGLKTAIEYIEELGFDTIASIEKELTEHALKRFDEIGGIRLIGTAENRASVVSFLIGDIHPFDAGTILDRMGLALRTGNHCTQPLMDFFGIQGTMRASFAIYNTTEEIDRLAEGIIRVKEMFA